MADESYSGSDETQPVILPSGASFYVYPHEVGYFNERVRRYLKDNTFTNIGDLQDVDRIVILELLVWRYGQWVAQQRDYWSEPVDEGALNKQIKEYSTELRQIKASLGVDKVSRDKQRGEDSVVTYLENLRVRAKAFGINRERMLDKGLELNQELIAKFTLYKNADETERREQKCDIGDLVKWIEEYYVPEFQKVDAHFRENEQRLWVRDQ